MDKNMEIIAALKCCGVYSLEQCEKCPYKDNNGGGLTCRQRLCQDAAEELADALNKAKAMGEEVEDMANERTELLDRLNRVNNELIKQKSECAELQECLDWNRNELKAKQTAVCSETKGLSERIEGLDRALKLQREICKYYEGQAEALKWFINFYLSPQNTLEAHTAEVPENV